MAEIKRKKKKLSPINLSLPTLIHSKKQTSAHKYSRNFEEPNGVVGLGILAALNDDRHRHNQDMIFNNGVRTAVLAISPKSASNPIPILRNKNVSKNNSCKKLGVEEMEFCEEYTCVISHFGKNQIKKREYLVADILGNYNGSPTVVAGNDDCSDSPESDGGETAAVGVGGFLSYCFLCGKMLHGLHVFMYRGEEAFCSLECRYRQITIDEHKGRCHSETRTPIEYSGSPCSVAAA